jgi:penicillin amidase
MKPRLRIWAIIMDWEPGQCASVYPGGQSENPLSPWYENQIPAWWNGLYYPLLMGNQAATVAGVRMWMLRP